MLIQNKEMQNKVIERERENERLNKLANIIFFFFFAPIDLAINPAKANHFSHHAVEYEPRNFEQIVISGMRKRDKDRDRGCVRWATG